MTYEPKRLGRGMEGGTTATRLRSNRTYAEHMKINKELTRSFNGVFTVTF